MVPSFNHLIGLFLVTAASQSTQTNALEFFVDSECENTYGINPGDSAGERKNKMVDFVTNSENCPSPDPEEDTSGCCFITPSIIQITAEEAFDALQTQSIRFKDTLDLDGVLMVDVRTPEELFWTGQPAQVNSINLMNEEEIIPKNYKATLRSKSGKGFKIEPYGGHEVSVDDVKSVDLSPIAISIPVLDLNPNTGVKTHNDEFGPKLIELFNGYFGSNRENKAAIFLCSSGKRSSVKCYFHHCDDLLDLEGVTFFEVEAVDEETNEEMNGQGGFEGSSYDNRYLGYKGFPDRLELAQDVVAFKDTGLPIVIMKHPQTFASNEDMKLPYKCLTDPSHFICNSDLFE